MKSAIGDLESEVKAATGVTTLLPLSGGRTNRVWLSGDTVFKVFDPSAASPLFANSADDEWTALHTLSETGLTPIPRSRFSTSLGPGISYGHISGAPGWGDIKDAARFLGRLHRIDPPQGLKAARSDEVLPFGASMLPKDHWLEDLAPPPPAQGPMRLVHRDPVFTNFVQGANALTLVDWQCPAIGDPVEDLAHFLSPAMNLLYRGRVLSMDEVSAFLDAYPDKGTCARYAKDGHAYHWRMACFAAWKVAQGKTAYAPALVAEAEILRDAARGANAAKVTAQ